jgi:UDP-GlcNAc:undecaprenyl-phosphate GlcNAc-1-phosphate transferase
VGFFMGYLSLPLLYALPREVGALSPLFLFAYPLTDLVTAVSRRLLRGKSPFAADRAHLHHRLCDVGVSHPQCTNILHLICASMETVGVLLCNGAFLLPAGIACLLSAVLLIYLRRTVAKSAASY